MTVYVDDMKASFAARHVPRTYVMSHMMANTLDELHAMAARIGVARRWFQDSESGPHYDIAQSKKALAIKAGAMLVTWRQLGCMAKRWRVTGELGDPATALEWRRQNGKQQEGLL